MTETYKKISTKKENSNDLEISKVVDEDRNFQSSTLLNSCQFANKQDKYVWEHLPLTNKQKEEILLALEQRITSNFLFPVKFSL